MPSLNDLILPFIAAQLYAFCFLYLLVVRRRYPKAFSYLALFLAAMIFFLGCYLFDQFNHTIHDAKLIHLRLFVLISIGFPSLTITGGRFSDQRWGWPAILFLYGMGGLLSSASIFFNSLAWRDSFNDQSLYFAEMLPGFTHASLVSRLCLLTATIGIVIIPCLYQLRTVRKKNLSHQAFLVSALLFSLIFFAGILSQEWWIYYTGTIACALIFLGAVYIDIHYLNQTSAFVMEELRIQVTQGPSSRLHGLIEKLETSSRQNIEVYKVRVREVISLLVNEAIESGGDVDDLIKRNKTTLQKIETAPNIETVTQVTEQEAQELSDIITDLPHERKRKLILEVTSYISSHLSEELNIQTLTKKFGVSRSHLTTAFREVQSTTVNQYIVSSRIEKSKELLHQKSITETAFDIGFNNSNYFSTVFKKHTGMTPKEYQQKSP